MSRAVSTVGPSALRCRGLRLSLGGRAVLDGLDLDAAPGEAIAVMGPSGSGKTTLLHCLAGLQVLDAGEVVLGGAVLTEMGHRLRARLRLQSIGMVFQFGELLDELTVWDNVHLPLRLRRECADAVTEAIRGVGLAGRERSWPAELSGGEVQRAAIARAIAGRPSLLLADEPTGALDEERSRSVCQLLRESARRAGATLVVATHDPIVAGAMDRTLQLRHGRLTP